MISSIYMILMAFTTLIFLKPYPKKLGLKIQGLRGSSFFGQEEEDQQKLPYLEKLKVVLRRFKLAIKIPE